MIAKTAHCLKDHCFVCTADVEDNWDAGERDVDVERSL